MRLRKFVIDGQKYIVFYKEHKFSFGKEINSSISFDLTSKEINMLEEKIYENVYKKLDSEEHIYTYLKHNGKNFVITIKEDLSLNYYEVIDGYYIKPTKEDYIYLENKFNLSYKKNIKKKKPKNLTKLDKLALLISLVVLVNCSKNLFSEISKMFININSVKQVMSNNEDLTEDDIDYLLNLLTENKDFVDYSFEQKRFQDLVVDQAYEKDEYCLQNSLVGYYDIEKNRIFVSGQDGSGNLTNEKINSIRNHELMHVCSQFSYKKGNSLCEALTETMSDEYADSYNIYDTYLNERMCLYSLCEIVDPDSFKEMFFTGSLKPLLKELNKIIDDDALANQLIDDIDLLNKLTNDDYIACKKEIYEILSMYYEAKYNIPMEEDMVIMTYLKYGNFINNGDVRITNLEPKGYFSSDYILKHPNLCYEYETVSKYNYFDTDYNVSEDMKILGYGIIYEDEYYKVVYQNGFIFIHEFGKVEVENLNHDKIKSFNN